MMKKKTILWLILLITGIMILSGCLDEGNGDGNGNGNGNGGDDDDDGGANEGTLTILVYDTLGGSPVDDVKVRIRYYKDDGSIVSRLNQTGSQGTAIFRDVPEGEVYLYIEEVYIETIDFTSETGILVYYLDEI